MIVIMWSEANKFFFLRILVIALIMQFSNFQKKQIEYFIDVCTWCTFEFF